MRIHPCCTCLLAATVFCAGSACAAQPDAASTAYAHDASLASALPVSDAVLAQARGGFDLGNGLLASFGISRMVYINGNLVAHVSIDIPDLSHIDSAQASALATLVNGVTLIRNGPGNFVDPASFNKVTGAIAIQNTLNNQQIQALTTIDTTVRNLNQFNSLNLANTLQSALVNSRGQ